MSQPQLDLTQPEAWKQKNHISEANLTTFFPEGHILVANKAAFEEQWNKIDIYSFDRHIGKSGASYYDSQVRQVIRLAACNIFRAQLDADPSLPKPTNVLQAVGWMDLAGNLTKNTYPADWSLADLETNMFQIYRRLGMMMKESGMKKIRKQQKGNQDEQKPQKSNRHRKSIEQVNLASLPPAEHTHDKDRGTKRVRSSSASSTNTERFKRLNIRSTSVTTGGEDMDIDSKPEGQQFDVSFFTQQTPFITRWMRIAVRNENEGARAIKHFPVQRIAIKQVEPAPGWDLEQLDYEIFQIEIKEHGFRSEKDSVFYYCFDMDNTTIVEVNDQISFRTAIMRQLRICTDVHLRFYFVETDRLNARLEPVERNGISSSYVYYASKPDSLLAKGSYNVDLASDSSDEEI